MNLPIPTHSNKKSVHSFAEEIANGLEFSPNDSIHDAVLLLGGSVEYSDPFEDGIPDSIRVNDYGDFIIYISSLTSASRDRFTIAHELGHYFLHYPNVRENPDNFTMYATRWVNENDDIQKRAEWEANWFAAGFLMPEEDFRAYYAANGLDETANYFKVSRSAACVRAKSLGLN